MRDSKIMREAASALEAMNAEIARLTADRNQMMKQVADLERQLAAETERCAEIADCFADQYDAITFTSTIAEQVAALRAKEQAANEIADAIRGGAK